MTDTDEVLEMLKEAQEHASEGRMDDVQWLLEAAVSDLEGLLGETAIVGNVSMPR
jgi:hypothetical protein